MPLTKTQPQFGKGRIVSAKITFEMPSTMKYTSSQKRDCEKACPAMANQKDTNDHR